MGLKILHSADWHLGSPFASFSETQRETLKKAQQRMPFQIAELCQREQCDMVFLAGDLFDGPWNQDLLELARNALESCGCPVLIAPGNHDPWSKASPWLELWPGNVFIFPPKLYALDLPELDCQVYGAGFNGMDCPSLLEGFRAEGKRRWQLGLFHGDPTNVNSNYNPVTAAQIRESGLHYLALGHIHSAGGLEIENMVCSWPGCPMGRGWDETGEKGCLIAELGDTVQVRTVTLETPRFYQQELELRDGKADLAGILPPAATEDFYRITLTGYGNPDLEALRREYGKFPNLELRSRTVDPGELWDQAGEDSLRGAYFERLRQQAEQADPETRKKILLAAEISRRLLDGREVQLP